LSTLDPVALVGYRSGGCAGTPGRPALLGRSLRDRCHVPVLRV